MKKRILEKFRRFCAAISREDRIAVVFHGDADGLASGVIAAKTVQLLRGKKPEMIFSQGNSEVELTEDSIKKMRKGKINKIILVDLAVDQNPATIRKAEKFAELLIIDHHKIYKNLNSERTIMIKAQHVSSREPSKYPAAKLTYDLFSNCGNLSDLEWVTAVGIIGDFGLKHWRKFIVCAGRRSKLSLKKMTELKELISAVEAVDGAKMNSLAQEFYKNIETPKRILSSKFKKYKKNYDTELKRLMKGFNAAEKYPEKQLVYYPFKSKYYIKSALVNKISQKFPKKTIILVQDRGNTNLHISARRQDFKVKVNELLENSLKGLNGTGGGHIPAAGGRVSRRDLGKFKEKLLENC
ncbi:MAG: DHHA1 domain-containing protein [Candidatus Diapherotrites archaeon]